VREKEKREIPISLCYLAYISCVFDGGILPSVPENHLCRDSR